MNPLQSISSINLVSLLGFNLMDFVQQLRDDDIVYY